MRIRYSFTSDIEDLQKFIKFYFENFNEKYNINKEITKLLKEFGKEELNHVAIKKLIEDLRVNLIKLDSLLEDTLLTTQTHLQASTTTPEISSEKEKEPASLAKEVQEEPTATPEKLAELQSSLNQLGNFTKNLKAARERGN
jgi:hypothetical protein